MKSILSSKTFWIAVVQFVAGGVAALVTTHPAVGALLMAKSILDVVVRMATTQPIGF